MPEAPEVKWVFMVVVIGALYMSKTKTNNGRISQPSRNATLVARQPRGGIHNALKPVASSVPSQRPLKY